jgi:uncharacterized iron-regulated membrane protein
VRVLVLPQKHDEALSLRMKQPEEWHPNGRTTLWFSPQTGALLRAQDANTLPLAARLQTKIYPLHTAAVGGIGLRIVLTLAGLGLCLLGGLSVWSLWRLSMLKHQD